jgi:hypothetical protein
VRSTDQNSTHQNPGHKRRLSAQPENLICINSSSSSSRIPAKPTAPSPSASTQMTRKNTVLHLKNPFVYPICGRNNAECRTFQTAHPRPTLRQKSRPDHQLRAAPYPLSGLVLARSRSSPATSRQLSFAFPCLSKSTGTCQVAHCRRLLPIRVFRS